MEPPLPHVAPEHETLEYWLARAEAYGSLDEPLLDPEAVARHDAALRQPREGEPIGQTDLLAPIDTGALLMEVQERLAYVQKKVTEGTLIDADGNHLDASAVQPFAVPDGIELEPEWRIVERLKALRCAPYEDGLYNNPVDLDFDRNRCSTMRDREVVQLLARWPNGMHLARTSYALGWVDVRGLSSPVDAAAVKEQTERPDVQLFTRRALLTEAFAMQGKPYGWGGKDGGYDCSRFLLDLFGRFGIQLPRHSSRQAEAGTFSIDVSEVPDLNEKRLLIEAAARRGVTLLHFPGHIMLYLGTTEEGVPMAMHAFSEFLTPCEGDLETINRVDRIAISDLSLGEGSSRTDFLNRITRITVLGRTPGPELIANAELRPSVPIGQPQGACRDSRRIAIFPSPHRPHASQRLRIIVTSERDPGFASLVLYDPDGNRVDLEQHVLDGPPHNRWVEAQEPAPGRWTAVFGEGDQTLACKRLVVAKHPRAPEPRAAPGPAWKATGKWERDAENLYSAFIEQLFREPVDDDITWSKLQELIADPERNLLYDYRQPGEDSRLNLEPDCADLPYFLRAYFAWKTGLPFAYRMCTRGRRGQPPSCEPAVLSNLDEVPDRDDVAAFRRFSRRLAGTVHSSSPRTLPSDDHTDFYPLHLSRNAIRPGTVFADPYGHVLVVARWKPQGVSDYGVLIGADAQPDGTVGRRRFWRGSFLFTPKTDEVGAGFKGWRPVWFEKGTAAEEAATVTEPVTEPVTEAAAATESVTESAAAAWQVRVATNADLAKAGAVKRWSDAQYRGSSDDFYSVMEGLINPRALDPVRMQTSLVDALEESVQRRLSSVQNGEDFMKAQGYATVPMPFGSALFLTTGPWEDYSTPSRDMRLLISIDAVVTFVDTVAANPERFGIREVEREATVERVKQALHEELEKRTFEYVRSDGTVWNLTVADVVARTKAMEVAYNPNDCVEIRWGAPQGSKERETCKRHAPADQQQRMKKYRSWFAKRERPQ